MKKKIDYIKSMNTYQKVSIAAIVLIIPAIIALSVSAISGFYDTKEAIKDVSSQISSMVSSMVSSKPSSSQTSSSKEPIKVQLKSSSVEEDLEVQILDENDELIVGPEFVLNVKSEKQNYEKDWDVNDGFLKLTKLDSGEYVVTIQELEGYIMPSEGVEVIVLEKVEYKEQDVSDLVVDEGDIDVPTEDSQYKPSTPAPPPPPTTPDTVKYVGSKVEKKKVEVEVITYKYKPNLMADDIIKTKAGTSSGIYAERDADGYLKSAYTLKEVKDEIKPANASFKFDFGYKVYALDDDNLNQENTTEPTTAPTAEPVATPTVEPVATPTAEPVATPTAEPVATPTAEPVATPTAEPVATPTAKPSASPSPTATVSPSASPSPTIKPSASPSPTVKPSASPTPTIKPSSNPTTEPSAAPTPEKVAVELFDKDGKILTSLNLDVQTVEVKSKVEKEVTVYYGWQTIDGKKYYYDENGKNVTGVQTIQGVTYDFGANGFISVGTVIGIDVSKYQPNIDWNAVKASGVEFAILRVGYRGYSTGALVEDPYFRSHIQGATAAGLKVGVYFFSQAITTQEAVEEASMALAAVKGYNLAYPIYFDTEYVGYGARADGLSTTHRTAIAKAFCETVQNAGYKAGVYASKSWFYYQLDYSQISQYSIWVAHYTSPATDFKYKYDIWQYTGTGSCAGIGGYVDLNIGYTHY